MKNYMFIYLAIVMLITLALVVKPNSSNTEKKLNEYYTKVKEVKNDNLKFEFLEKFPTIFTFINKIEVYTGDDENYYYYIEGEFQGEVISDMFKINEQDYFNESYSYLDFTNINNENLEYCREYTERCERPGCHYGYPCKGPICGFLTSSGCVVY